MGAEPPLAGRSRTRGGFTPFLPRATTKSGATPDVTLVNLNLMLANVRGYYDEENYVPMGLLYIAACLERAGYGVELVDYQLAQ